MSPTTSPMRVAAVPSCDIVVTVRCASETARPATSVDFAGCAAISPIEAASSSTELAAAVTFSEAAVTRLVAVSASEETVSAALLRSDELISSFIDAPRSLPSALSTECLNCEIVDAITSLRCSRARPASLCVCASRSRSIMLSRNTMTVRAMSPISSRALVAGIRAVVSPSARRVMTRASPFSGRVMLRPISQLMAVDVDNRMQRPHFVITLDPFAECFGIGLHHLLERRFHFRCGVEWPDDIGEGLIRLLKLLACDVALGDAEVGLVVPHVQKSYHQFVGVCFGKPGHVVVDDALDGVSSHLKLAA